MIAIRLLLIFTLAGVLFPPTMATALELKQNDHIAIIGNALPDRMQHDGWLETYLQCAHPDKALVIRNLGFTGDEIAVRPRNKDFKNEHDYLTHVEADVIFAFFGYNESFRKNPKDFREQITDFIEDIQTRNYNGESAPRLVLFSPIPVENLGSPNFPDGAARNEWLSTYSDAMASVARRMRVEFIDLYYPMEELYESSKDPLTINGVHLNHTGNQAVADVMRDQLLGKVDLSRVDSVRAAVLEKNRYWFNRYRATDGNDIWGGRGDLSFVDGQTNRAVLAHELVMLDAMTANRDGVIWAAANGKSIKSDDSNVPDPVMVVTNINPRPENRAEDGGHKFVSPEEGADTLVLEDSMAANLFASEKMFPGFVNPVQLDVDTRGRLWVAVWATYPKWQPDQEMRDRLVILPDENRDGVADEMKTFAWVHNPTGFTFWNGGVLVASAPEILFLKDTDGDDIADIREVWLSGLDSADTHHSASGFDYGPDGYIYYQRGIFNVSNVETPWETAQLSGRTGMYRFNPRTFRFRFHASNAPNPHGGDFDRWGYQFSTSATGGEAYQVLPKENGEFKMQKLLDKTVRPVASSGIISSAHFPEKNNGNFIILNTIGFLGIKQYTLEYTDGKVWGTETADLLRSTDSNFRPTDFKIGDDGAMYISDWSNPIIGHMQHNVRDPNRDHDHGRIYRITAEGRPLQVHVPVDGEPIEALLEVLKHPVDGIRLRARIELSERDSGEVLAATQQWIQQFDTTSESDAHHLLEALWLHQQHDSVNQELLDTLLKSPHVDARHAAERVRFIWDYEGKFSEASEQAAARPTFDRAAEAQAVLAEARDYLKQDASPEPRMVDGVFEVHIQTLKEQMRYDRTRFIVTPGLRVRLIFKNPDAMDHNLIMVMPNSASPVALAAARMETTGDGVEKQWIPDSDKILFASNILSHDEMQTIEFIAPTADGEYDYICTFPGHWQLMRGVMEVDSALHKDRLASVQPRVNDGVKSSNRGFVAYWELDDLKNDLSQALSHRSFIVGKEMFSAASCNQCHAVGGEGGTIGPDLAGIAEQYSPIEILEHIIDPSDTVSKEYEIFIVTTKDSELMGTVVEEDKDSITLIENALEPEKTQRILRTDIQSMDRIDLSPMPSDLLASLNKEEIWDLVAYLASNADPKHDLFQH